MSTHIEKDDAPEGTTQNPPDATPEATTVPKPKTIPTTYRLTEPAFHALKVLEAKNPKMTRAAVMSMTVIAYAKKAAAAPVIKTRMLHDDCLFALQAAASDIKLGLQSFQQQLFTEKKSSRDPAALTAAFSTIAANFRETFAKAEATLGDMDREHVLHDILNPNNTGLLKEIIEDIEKGTSPDPRKTQKRELLLTILKTLIP